MTEPHVYEVFAIKYAAMPDRQPWMNFIGVDAHDGPLGLDFYIWLIQGADGPGSSTSATTARWPRSAAAPSSATRSRGWS